jgi:hypothetical protein
LKIFEQKLTVRFLNDLVDAANYVITEAIFLTNWISFIKPSLKKNNKWQNLVVNVNGKRLGKISFHSTCMYKIKFLQEPFSIPINNLSQN